MLKGKVKWYNRIKGFGFIENEKGEDIFVHRTGLVNSYMELQDGQKIVFDTKESKKGLTSFNVELA